jgi:hypothetical protein
MTAATTGAVTRATRREPVESHVNPGEWRHGAACRAVDPEVFFPAPVAGLAFAKRVGVAKAVCAGCPVREACLTWALSALPEGIAGGMTEHERRTERARRVRARRAVASSSRTGKGAPAATDAPVSQVFHGAALQGTRAAEGHRS